LKVIALALEGRERGEVRAQGGGDVRILFDDVLEPAASLVSGRRSGAERPCLGGELRGGGVLLFEGMRVALQGGGDAGIGAGRTEDPSRLTW
jgi:hypothetical protein